MGHGPPLVPMGANGRCGSNPATAGWLSSSRLSGPKETGFRIAIPRPSPALDGAASRIVPRSAEFTAGCEAEGRRTGSANLRLNIKLGWNAFV